MTISYQHTTWQQHQQHIMSVRNTVFINEQNVPVELEIDEHDPDCLHLLAHDNDKAIGTARLLDDGHIGRMCVLKEYRLQGVATEMLLMLITHAFNNGIKSLKLNAQLSAIPFYEKTGFKVDSDVFLDANIEHKSMHINLT